MEFSEIIEEIMDKFNERIEVKTGWGKNEVKTILMEVVISVLSNKIG